MNWPIDDAGIVLLVLTNEGDYINNSNDQGGSTKYGITIDTLASWRKTPVTDQDVKNLSIQEATEIYTQKYIIGPNFDQLTDVKLRAALVDFGVLFGPILAIQSLQAILKLPQDGILGPDTLRESNTPTDKRTVINQLSGARIGYHADRVTNNPSQLQFLRGWLSRALMFIE